MNVKDKESEARRIGREIVAAVAPEQLSALGEWAEKMQEIRSSSMSLVQKAKAAILATSDRKVLLPVMTVASRELVRIGWTERGLPARMAIGAAAAALTLTGQGAGIAALGGAIGVPLFVVFGAGGALVGVIIDEVRRKKGAPK